MMGWESFIWVPSLLGHLVPMYYFENRPSDIMLTLAIETFQNIAQIGPIIRKAGGRKREQDHSRWCQYVKIVFLAAILIFFFENAVQHIGGSYQSNLLILNSKQWKTTFYLVILQIIGQRLRPWERPNEKVQNGRHAVIDFEILKS